jgi:hypothetical protein
MVSKQLAQVGPTQMFEARQAVEQLGQLGGYTTTLTWFARPHKMVTSGLGLDGDVGLAVRVLAR